MPLNRSGEIDPKAPYVEWWYEVTALIATRRLKLGSITRRSVEGTLLSHLKDSVLTLAPMNTQIIAVLAGKKEPAAEASELGLKPPAD